MAIQISKGVSGVVKKIQPVSIGVSGVVRNVTEGHVGIGSVVRQIYQDGLTLYDHGKTDYSLSTQANSGASAKGVIDTDCCYINTGSMLGDWYGNSGLSSHLNCPQFVISGVSELNSEDILKYTKLEVTYEIGKAFSTVIDDTEVVFGGWAGHEWDYDSDQETKGDSYYWRCCATHAKGETGVFTTTFDITSTTAITGIYHFLRNTAYCNAANYKKKATNFYFGASNYVRSGSDCREEYCRVPVYFYQIRLL